MSILSSAVGGHSKKHWPEAGTWILYFAAFGTGKLMNFFSPYTLQPHSALNSSVQQTDMALEDKEMLSCAIAWLNLEDMTPGRGGQSQNIEHCVTTITDTGNRASRSYNLMDKTS